MKIYTRPTRREPFQACLAPVHGKLGCICPCEIIYMWSDWVWVN